MGLSLYSDIWVNRIANAKNKTKKQDLIYCDIYRAANLLIKQHGDDAPKEMFK